MEVLGHAIEELSEFIISTLQRELDPRLTYHCVQHSQRVMESVLILAESAGLDEPDRTKLQLAAVAHDVGFLVREPANEYFGAAFMAHCLSYSHGFTLEKLYPHYQQKFLRPELACQNIVDEENCSRLFHQAKRVPRRVFLSEAQLSIWIEELSLMILSTMLLHRGDGSVYREALTPLSGFLLDADLSGFGSESFSAQLSALLQEKRISHQADIGVFLLETRQMLSDHRWFTAEAHELYGNKLLENQCWLDELINNKSRWLELVD